MLVLEKLRDNYASADFATQFLEAAIRKADIDVMMGNAASRDRMRPEDVQATLTSDKVKELRERSRAARRTPPPSGEDLHIRPDFQISDIMDIGVTGGRRSVSLHEAISARTPPDSDTHTNFTSTTTNEVFTPVTNINEIDFSMNANPGVDLDMNDFLNFDSNNDIWTLPLEQGAHGESGGFMGDMNWIDQEVPMWSRLSSPMLDLGEVEKMNGVHDPATNWGRLESPGPEVQEIFGISLGQPKMEVEGLA